MKLIVAFAILFALWWLAQRKAAGATLSVAEARKILSVSPEAGTADIVAAHRRLIAKVHPDAGGSEDLARRVNLARDVLLKGRDGG